ncbi:hypothetical protein PVAND_014131 [Polypedilum vanderplanki]|uniref:glutathione transferase n=1 Tax=Polypedilum vanderplanki TaxID=319348 RepID=A0A9J6CTF5_POLVA|nr:hypothetical protein PVAND_014131 [Polypedilum vanderplanki]
MKFYFDLLSQPSRALYIFLKVTKTPVEFVKIDLKRLEHLTNEFKAVNRFQKVPCIVDNGFKLSESVAIFRYLMQSNPNISENWYPKDAKSRALVDEFLEYQHIGVRYPCAIYFQTKWLLPTFSGKPPNEKKVREYENLMIKSLDTFENIWLASDQKEFLATKEISFADILACCELEQPRMADFDTFKDRPRLKKWHEKVKKETNPYYDEAHKNVYDIIQSKGKLSSKFDLVFIYRYLRYIKFKKFFE